MVGLVILFVASHRRTSYQQFALPSHQFRRVPVPITREVAQCGFAGDERGVNGQLEGVGIAALGQFGVTAAFSLARALEFLPNDIRLPVSGNGKSGPDCFKQSLATARRHSHGQKIFHRMISRRRASDFRERFMVHLLYR